jgi:hypothetical protein
LNQRPPIELPERKMRAAELAGFERGKSGSFRKNVIDHLFNLENDQILDMVFDYLKHQNNHIWTEIQTTEQSLDEYTKLRLSPVSDDKDKDTLTAAEKKEKLRTFCNAMIKDLKDYYEEFFKDHDDVKESVAAEKKYFRVEDFAKDA